MSTLIALHTPNRYTNDWPKSRAGPLDGIDHWEYIASPETAAGTDGPRQEMMYNFDPYTLRTNSDDS